MINSGNSTNKSYQTKTVIMLFGFLVSILGIILWKNYL